MSSKWTVEDVFKLQQITGVISVFGTEFQVPKTLQELGMKPKPVPFLDNGILEVLPEHDIHICLEKAPIYAPMGLIPFVAQCPESGKFYPLMPGCSHEVLFNEPLDVLVHLYQEHLARVSKNYFCLKCANDPHNSSAQFKKSAEAKRHSKTENEGAVNICKVCYKKFKRKDALDNHVRSNHC